MTNWSCQCHVTLWPQSIFLPVFYTTLFSNSSCHVLRIYPTAIASWTTICFGLIKPGAGLTLFEIRNCLLSWEKNMVLAFATTLAPARFLHQGQFSSHSYSVLPNNRGNIYCELRCPNVSLCYHVNQPIDFPPELLKTVKENVVTKLNALFTIMMTFLDPNCTN
jgi:hypothetical protein